MNQLLHLAGKGALNICVVCDYDGVFVLCKQAIEVWALVLGHVVGEGGILNKHFIVAWSVDRASLHLGLVVHEGWLADVDVWETWNIDGSSPLSHSFAEMALRQIKVDL